MPWLQGNELVYIIKIQGGPKNGTSLVHHTEAVIRDKLNLISLACSQNVRE